MIEGGKVHCRGAYRCDVKGVLYSPPPMSQSGPQLFAPSLLHSFQPHTSSPELPQVDSPTCSSRTHPVRARTPTPGKPPTLPHPGRRRNSPAVIASSLTYG